MHGLKSLGSTFFSLKKERRGKRRTQDDLSEAGIGFTKLPQSCLDNSPTGPLCFVSQPDILCSD